VSGHPITVIAERLLPDDDLPDDHPTWYPVHAERAPNQPSAVVNVFCCNAKWFKRGSGRTLTLFDHIIGHDGVVADIVTCPHCRTKFKVRLSDWRAGST
jgi:hypothetical protein